MVRRSYSKTLVFVVSTFTLLYNPYHMWSGGPTAKPQSLLFGTFRVLSEPKLICGHKKSDSTALVSVVSNSSRVFYRPCLQSGGYTAQPRSLLLVPVLYSLVHVQTILICAREVI